MRVKVATSMVINPGVYNEGQKPEACSPGKYYQTFVPILGITGEISQYHVTSTVLHAFLFTRFLGLEE